MEFHFVLQNLISLKVLKQTLRWIGIYLFVPVMFSQLGSSHLREIVFSPKELKWYAYQDKVLIREGKASGGAEWCDDLGRACRTPQGVFHVMRMGGIECHSSRFPIGSGGAPMKFCMFFAPNYALHASDEVFAYNASHGCVRIIPKEARWLNRHFVTYGTRVTVQAY